MTALHAGCRVKNIRKGSQRRILVRLQSEVFVRHTVHDVQLPVQGATMGNGVTHILPAKIWSNVLYFKGGEPY